MLCKVTVGLTRHDKGKGAVFTHTCMQLYYFHVQVVLANYTQRWESGLSATDREMRENRFLFSVVPVSYTHLTLPTTILV